MTVEILSAGAVTSVGHNVVQCDVSIRAGIIRRRATHVQGESGPIYAAPVLAIGDHIVGVDRGLRLFEVAVEECLRAAPSLGSVGLVSCVANYGFFAAMERFSDAQRKRCALLRDSWLELTPQIVAALGRRGLCMSHEHVREIAKGQPSALEGLVVAGEWLQSGAVDHVVVTAVASQCDRAFLEVFDRLGVLARPGSATGHVPSEGAVVLLLSGAGGAGVAAKSFHVNSGDPPTAEALTSVLDAAMSDPSAGSAREMLTDVNGERWRVNEMSMASLRCISSRNIPMKRLDVARFTGELGAAGAALSLALCHHALRRDGVSRVVASSTRGPSRGAAIVTRET